MRRSVPIPLFTGMLAAWASAGCSAPRGPAAPIAEPGATSLPGPIAPPSPEAGTGSMDSGALAVFQACRSDSDCVAVPRVGCCHNGWMEAVAASQKDAYEASFTCPQAHPVCAMFIVRDSRAPACDEATHLCVMVRR